MQAIPPPTHPTALSKTRAMIEGCIKRFYAQHRATSTEGEIRILVLKWGNFPLSIHGQASEKVRRLGLDWEARKEASSGTVSQQVAEGEGRGQVVRRGRLRMACRVLSSVSSSELPPPARQLCSSKTDTNSYTEHLPLPLTI